MRLRSQVLLRVTVAFEAPAHTEVRVLARDRHGQQKKCGRQRVDAPCAELDGDEVRCEAEDQPGNQVRKGDQEVLAERQQEERAQDLPVERVAPDLGRIAAGPDGPGRHQGVRLVPPGHGGKVVGERVVVGDGRRGEADEKREPEHAEREDERMFGPHETGGWDTEERETAACRVHGKPEEERGRFAGQHAAEAEPSRRSQRQPDARLEEAPRHQDRQQHPRRGSGLDRGKRQAERQRPHHDRREGEQVEEVMRQGGQYPSIVASRSRWYAGSPNATSFQRARLNQRCRSCSHVKPIPPCICTERSTVRL